jgi:hypothetical protein
MAWVRVPNQSTSYVPITSPDTPSTEDAVGNELRAVSETALIAQGIELVSDIQQGDWMSTDDYSTADSNPDRDDSLTTSDIDNQLTAAAERSDARRASPAKLLDRRSENAQLLVTDSDIDVVLYLDELNDIVAGGGARNAEMEQRDINPKLDKLKIDQSFRDKGMWMKG